MKLVEALFDYKQTPTFLTKKLGKNYEIFINPTKKEMLEFKGEGFRFLADAKKKDFYIFPVYILHEVAAQEIYGDIELYKMSEILLGNVGGDLRIDYLTAYEEKAYKIFGKNYYKKQKGYDWSWVEKYVAGAQRLIES